MKRLNGIVESEFAPSKHDMWLFKGSLKYFGPNGWTDISAESEPYVLPAATTSAIGGVKKATNVGNLATGAELATVVTKVNAILSALKVADIMVEDAN